MSFRWIIVIVLLAVTACSPSARQSTTSQPLPTIAALPSPTPEAFSFESAERVARLFLEGWRTGDFATMHDLITFGGQEATPLETFTALYQDAQTTMTLEGLDYTLTSQILAPGDIMTFSYDVTFMTHLLGEFVDNNRTLRLAFDPSVSQWRVAWSPGDIFAAMGNGGQLRFEPRIPSRANIYTADGEVLADQNAKVVTVNVVKKDIPAYETCLAELAVAMSKDAADIQALLAQRGENWLTEVGTIEPVQYIQKHADLERDCKAQFRDRAARRYASGPVTSDVVGYVGYPTEAQIPDLAASGFSQESIIGQTGVEASWDETLRGRPGGRLVVVYPDGEQVVLAEGASQPSESVWLTIDPKLQAFVERVFERAYTNARDGWAKTSKGAAAVVMEVNTGVIRALVSYPTFDNNAFTPFPTIGRENANRIVEQVQNDERRPQLNRATLGIYPAGSTFKVVPAIAAADSGVYELDHKFMSVGVWDRDIKRYDWLAGGHGLLTLPQFIKYSCNSCFYETGYDLDQADPFLLPSYARRLGLGQLTGLRDLTESAGNIIDPEIIAEEGGTWTFSNAVNMAIGQGEVQVTPLQMARMYAAIANGGTLYRPQLVEKVGILGETPSQVMTPDPMSDTDIKPEVLDMVRGGLCAVVNEQGGTAEHIFRRSPLLNIGVCGKTGTAQATGDVPPHAWFIGYAPRDEPEIVVLVMVENAGEGSAIAAPLVREIMEYYFFGLDPDMG